MKMRKAMLLATLLLAALPVAAGPEEPESVPKEPLPPDAATVDSEAAEAARMRYSPEIRDARRLYQWGMFMTFGGLGLVLLSAELPSAFGTLGGLAYVAGEPMMGIGAGRLNRFASAVPGHVDPGGGWGYYGAGWSLKGGGTLWLIYVMLSNLEVAGAGPILFPYVEVTWEDVALPLLTIASGYVCEGVALYKFHARQKAARTTLSSGLSFRPTLRRDSGGGFQGGLALTLAFE